MKTVIQRAGTKVIQYDSLAEAGEDLDAYNKAGKGYSDSGNSGFETGFYGATMGKTVKQIAEGYPEGASKIEAAFDASIRPIDSSGHRWDNDIAGAYPVMPAYFAGSPMHMRNRRTVKNQRQPIRVFMSIAVSASFSKEELRERTLAVAQFVQYLSIQRPVEFFVFAELDKGIPLIRIQTSPLNLGTLAFLCEPQALRRMMFALADCTVGWVEWNNVYGNVKLTREAIGANEDDIIIVGAKSGDGLAGKTPQQWLKDSLEQYGLLNK